MEIVLEDIASDGVKFNIFLFQSGPSLAVTHYSTYIHQTPSQRAGSDDGYNNWRWCERAALEKTLLECLI